MSEKSLRQQAVQAGVYLTLRRVVGLVLSFIGLLYLTRSVGPNAYGAYTAAFSVIGYVLTVGTQGGRVYLIRQPENAALSLFDLTFWWLFAGGAGTAALLGAASIGLLALDSRETQFATALAWLAITLPLSLVRGVPTALLERRLDYSKLSVIEISGQLLVYIVGIPLALKGAGIGALIVGYICSELWQTLLTFGVARYRPRWCWNPSLFRESISESLKMSAGAWMYELRRFGVPLVLLPLAGERAVGYYALADRLIGALSFITNAIAQLSVPIYAKLQQRPQELLRAIYLSAQAQLLAYGGATVGVILIAPLVLPKLLGDQWDISVVVLTSAVSSLHMILFVIFGAQAQAMYVIRKTSFMLWSNVLLIACLFPFLWGGTLIVPAPYKPVGYTLGYLLAHQPTHLLIHWAVKRWIGKPIYGMNLIWAAGLGAAMFAPFTHYWSLLGLLVFLHPASLRAAREVKALLLEARQSKKKGAQASDQNTV